MIIKKKGFNSSHLNYFDLLGYDERSLSKSFAYLLANSSSLMFKFLHFIGIGARKTKNNFKDIKIQIEKFYEEDEEGNYIYPDFNKDKKSYRNKRNKRSYIDIDIKMKDIFHIIIECKIGANKVKEQKERYFNLIKKSDVKEKVLCFITNEKGGYSIKESGNNGVRIISIPWLDVYNLIYENFKVLNKNKNKDEARLLEDFLKYIIRGYKIKNYIKEILVQDVSDKNEIKRFLKHYLYRRDKTYGIPLYFAPYFTKKATKHGEKEGISYIAKVLGVLTINPKKYKKGLYENELMVFAENAEGNVIGEKLVEKWEDGITLTKKSDKDQEYTYYFLEEPIEIEPPLKKDGGIRKGRGKNWIAAAIPKNRGVEFKEFIKRLVKAKKQES